MKFNICMVYITSDFFSPNFSPKNFLPGSTTNFSITGTNGIAKSVTLYCRINVAKPINTFFMYFYIFLFSCFCIKYY